MLQSIKTPRYNNHKELGVDQQTLLKLHRTLIQLKIDYGCFIYGSARKSYHKSLITLLYEGLKLVLGSFRTSPVEILYTNAHEPPLHLRFQKLGLQYNTKIKSLRTNTAHDCIFSPK